MILPGWDLIGWAGSYLTPPARLILEWHASNPSPLPPIPHLQMLLLCKFCHSTGATTITFMHGTYRKIRIIGTHHPHFMVVEWTTYTLLMHILPPSLRVSCVVCQQLLLWHLMQAQHWKWSPSDASGSWSGVWVEKSKYWINMYVHPPWWNTRLFITPPVLPVCKYRGQRSERFHHTQWGHVMSDRLKVGTLMWYPGVAIQILCWLVWSVLNDKQIFQPLALDKPYTKDHEILHQHSPHVPTSFLRYLILHVTICLTHMNVWESMKKPFEHSSP